MPGSKYSDDGSFPIRALWFVCVCVYVCVGEVGGVDPFFFFFWLLFCECDMQVQSGFTLEATTVV